MIALFLMMLALLYGWVTALYDLWYFTIPAVYYRFSVLLMGLAMGCAVFFMPWSATLSFWLDHGLGFLVLGGMGWLFFRMGAMGGSDAEAFSILGLAFGLFPGFFLLAVSHLLMIPWYGISKRWKVPMGWQRLNPIGLPMHIGFAIAMTGWSLVMLFFFR